MIKCRIVTLTSALLLAACAQSPFGGSDQPHSGFLGDYSNLQPVASKDKGETLRWVTPDLVKGKYKKAIVMPVTYYPEPKTGPQVSTEALNSIAAYLTSQIKVQVGKNLELTDQPGPDTLKIQTAITGVETSAEGLKFYEVLPVTLVFAGASTLIGTRDRVVTVYAEGLATDSVTGQPLVKGLREGVGKDLDNNREPLKLDQVKPLLDSWAVSMGELSKGLN